MAKQTILTSLMGRALGLNSSGHLVTPRDKVDQDLYPAADVGNINAGVATGATAENYGVTVLGAGDTASAASYEITAPAPGVKVELHIGCSASELTLGGTATSVIFKPAVGWILHVPNQGKPRGWCHCTPRRNSQSIQCHRVNCWHDNRLTTERAINA